MPKEEVLLISSIQSAHRETRPGCKKIGDLDAIANPGEGHIDGFHFDWGLERGGTYSLGME